MVMGMVMVSSSTSRSPALLLRLWSECAQWDTWDSRRQPLVACHGTCTSLHSLLPWADIRHNWSSPGLRRRGERRRTRSYLRLWELRVVTLSPATWLTLATCIALTRGQVCIKIFLWHTLAPGVCYCGVWYCGMLVWWLGPQFLCCRKPGVAGAEWHC